MNWSSFILILWISKRKIVDIIIILDTEMNAYFLLTASQVQLQPNERFFVLDEQNTYMYHYT